MIDARAAVVAQSAVVVESIAAEAVVHPFVHAVGAGADYPIEDVLGGCSFGWVVHIP